jgi:BirA family biotin operon repressor/biotin-[acetyl-CoA-carboxylase] ligase
MIDQKKLEQLIHEKSMLIEVFESLPSTQDYLKALLGDKQIRLCIAEHQTKGRGRFDRHWHAPAEKNVYLSMLYSFHQEIRKLGGLSLIVGLSLCKRLNSLYTLPHPILMKWPNDLMCDHKKIAGILVEVKAEAQDVSYTNIGIGINVNMLDDDKKIIGQDWTSLQKLTGQYHDRNVLIAALINQLLIDLNTFSEHGFEPFLNGWNHYDLLHNKSITLKMGNHEFTGIAQGLNEYGHLLVKLHDTQEIKAFSSGDTTIVKQ